MVTRVAACLSMCILLIGLTVQTTWPVTTDSPRTAARQLAFDRAGELRRTINVGRWFGREVPETGSHYLKYVSIDEANLIHKWGFTAVRLAIREPFLFVSSPADRSLDVNKLKYLLIAIKRLNAAGLIVIVDFHSKERNLHEHSEDYQQKMIIFWKLLSKFLSDRTDPDKVMLELLNEPRFVHDTRGWNSLQKKLLDTVRKSAPLHTIIATSTKYSDPQTFESLDLLDDDNVIYTFHTYDPIAFTHQGASFLRDPYSEVRGLGWPPSADCERVGGRYATNSKLIDYVSSYCKSGWNSEKFADYLAPAVRWGKVHDVPIFVGEFGARSGAMPEADRFRWLKMAKSYFDKQGLSWALWSFDDCYGLALKVQGACPAGADEKVDNTASWKRACRTLAILGLRPGDCTMDRPRELAPDA